MWILVIKFKDCHGTMSYVNIKVNYTSAVFTAFNN